MTGHGHGHAHQKKSALSLTFGEYLSCLGRDRALERCRGLLDESSTDDDMSNTPYIRHSVESRFTSYQELLDNDRKTIAELFPDVKLD